MSNWLDLSDNANCFESMYVKGFVDISAGSLQLRNADNHLLVGGDASFNGEVYLEQNLLIGTETGHSGYAADISGIVDISGNLFTQGDVSMNGNLYVSGDCNIDGALSLGSESINASNISFSSDISMNNRLFINMSDVSYNSLLETINETIFANNPSITQLGQDIDGEAGGDNFGWSTSINGDGTIVAVGAIYNTGNGNAYNSGHVRIFQYNDISWVQLGTDIEGEDDHDYSGYSVSLNNDGTIVAIGATGNDGNGYYSGHTRIYRYNDISWVQLGTDIDGENQYDESGYTVSLNDDGTIVAIGSIYNVGTTTSNAGHVRIYQYNDISWVQLGQDIDGEAENDYSGRSISLNSDGTIVAIGAYLNDGTASNAGHVRIYQYNDISWVQLGQDIDGKTSNEFSGKSVSLNNNGTIVVIGSYGYTSYTGLTRIYQYNDVSWVQMGSDIYAENSSDQFGWSTSINGDGTIIAIGAHYNDGTTTSNAGHVRIFQYNSTDNSWYQLGQDIDGEAVDDNSGYSISLNNNGTRIAIGAYHNDGNGNNSGHVRIYELEHTTTTYIYHQIHSDIDSSGTFSTDVSLNNSLVVSSNITIVDSSSNNYGSYTVYTDKAATNFFSVGKSASNVFNIVDQDNAGVYMASGSTSLTSTSDIRLKTEVESLEDATDKLMQLKPCTYKWKTQDEADPKKHVGFIAQEVDELFPNLVNENTYPDENTYKGVATTDLIPYLVKTLQYTTKKLDKLKSSFTSLQKA